MQIDLKQSQYGPFQDKSVSFLIDTSDTRPQIVTHRYFSPQEVRTDQHVTLTPKKGKLDLREHKWVGRVRGAGRY